MVTIYGSQRDHGRKEILQNEKKISIQNIAQLSSWTQLLVTNSLAVQQNALTKLLSSKAKHPLIRVEISSDSHPFYTGRQKFTQADGRDRFNKNTVSNNDKRTVTTVLFFFFMNQSLLLFYVVNLHADTIIDFKRV